MAKTNITVAKPLAWDEYKDKQVDEALPGMYEHALTSSSTFTAWYWKSIRSKKLSSQTIRLLALFLLAAGTVLPIVAGVLDDVNTRLLITQIGVSALAVAGLLQIADRVFGWSSGWQRYIKTVTSMENAVRNFQLTWADYIVGKGGPLVSTDIKVLFDQAKQLEESLMKLQDAETDQWVTEFNAGYAVLGDAIRSQREIAQKTVDAAIAMKKAADEAAEKKEKAGKKGAVEVTITHKAAPVPVTIKVDEQPEEQFLGTVWSKLDLPAGHHVITIITKDGAAETIKKVVDISPGGIATAAVKIG